jgi:hypothetical protein
MARESSSPVQMVRLVFPSSRPSARRSELAAVSLPQTLATRRLISHALTLALIFAMRISTEGLSRTTRLITSFIWPPSSPPQVSFTQTRLFRSMSTVLSQLSTLLERITAKYSFPLPLQYSEVTNSRRIKPPLTPSCSQPPCMVSPRFSMSSLVLTTIANSASTSVASATLASSALRSMPSTVLLCTLPVSSPFYIKDYRNLLRGPRKWSLQVFPQAQDLPSNDLH